MLTTVQSVLPFKGASSAVGCIDRLEDFMQTAKWDFQIAQPEQDGDEWRIGYTLISPIAGVPSERIAIDERFHSAHGAIAEATRLAQIHVADLNGEAPTFERPSDAEVPFDKDQRF
ncbi:hypothetical protein ACWGPO_26975 [Achromobacter animicus]